MLPMICCENYLSLCVFFSNEMWPLIKVHLTNAIKANLREFLKNNVFCNYGKKSLQKTNKTEAWISYEKNNYCRGVSCRLSLILNTILAF